MGTNVAEKFDVCPCIIDTNNIDNQLAGTITVY